MLLNSYLRTAQVFDIKPLKQNSSFKTVYFEYLISISILELPYLHKKKL